MKLSASLILGLSMWFCVSCAQDAAMDRPDNCTDLSALDLQGTWTITAQGRRTGCTNPRNNGNVDILVRELVVYPQPIPTEGRPSFDGVGDEADAFVERIRNAEVELLLDQRVAPPPVMVDDELLPAFSGGGSGCMLYFDLREALPNQELLLYDFEGFVVDYDRAVGTFEGSGPETCELEGEFEVRSR